jgi:uncharacterized membrane protein YesL
MEMRGFIGGFYLISQWVMRLSITNILWIIFNLPIIYFIINLLFLDNRQSFLLNILVLTFLLPLIFFPATTALFGVVRRWGIKDFDAPLVRLFVSYYKLNYIRSLLGGVIIVPIWVVLFMNFLYYSDRFGTTAMIVFMIVAMFLVVITCHFFSITVHMEMNLLDSLRSSIYLCFGNVFHSVAIFLTIGLIFYVSFYLVTFLVPLLLGSLFSYVAFLGYFRSFTRVQTIQKL